MEIEIKKKKYPIHFGTAALRLFCIEKKITIDQLLKWLNTIDMEKMSFDQFDDIVLLVFSGVRNGLRIEGRKDDFDLELEDFYDWLDDGGDINAIFEEITASMSKGEESGNPKPVKVRKK